MAADLAIKEPVRVATTENIVTLSGLQTIDDVTLVSGDRVLVRAQTTATQNGLYVAAAGAWTRTSDFDGAGEVTGGTQVFVTSGTLLADSSWRVAGEAPITIGIDPISFEAEFVQTGTDAVGRTLQAKAREIVSVADFGAVGGGVADDTNAILAAIAHVDAVGGGTVRLLAGKAHKTTAQITLKGGISLDCNEGKIVAYLSSGDGCAVQVRSNCRVMNGHIQVVSSGSPGSSGTVHAAIRLGPIYGQGGTVAAPSPDDDVTGFVIRNMILESDKDLGEVATGGAAALAVIGNVYNGLIEGVTFPSSEFLTAAISLDWGVRGTVGVDQAIVSLPAAMDTNQENFLNGDGFTTHPHNITIRNVLVGVLSRPYQGTATTGSYGVRISGCYGIRFENVLVAGTTEGAFVSHAGDLGFEFARTGEAPYPEQADAPFALKGNSFRGCICAEANGGVAVSTDSTADNVQRAIDEESYESLYPHGALWPTDIVFEQVHGRTTDATPVDGIWAYDQLGGEIKDCSATGFKSGLRAAGTTDLRVVGGRYSFNREQGIFVNDNAVRTLFKDIVECASNNLDDDDFSNLFIETGDGTVIDGGVYGADGADSALHCIRTTQYSDGGKRLSIVNQPTILSHGSGGFALVIGYSESWGTLALFEGVTYASGVTNRYYGQAAVPIERRAGTTRYEVASGQDLSGLGVVRGDTFEYSDPSAAGKRGKICTTAGTVGSGAVLKEYGAIDS